MTVHGLRTIVSARAFIILPGALPRQSPPQNYPTPSAFLQLRVSRCVVGRVIRKKVARNSRHVDYV